MYLYKNRAMDDAVNQLRNGRWLQDEAKFMEGNMLTNITALR